jgi:hypothetical protein
MLGVAVDNDVSVIFGRWSVDSSAQYDNLPQKNKDVSNADDKTAYMRSVDDLDLSVIVEKEKFIIQVHGSNFQVAHGQFEVIGDQFIFNGSSINELEEVLERRTTKMRITVRRIEDKKISVNFSNQTMLGATMYLKRP